MAWFRLRSGQPLTIFPLIFRAFMDNAPAPHYCPWNFSRGGQRGGWWERGKGFSADFTLVPNKQTPSGNIALESAWAGTIAVLCPSLWGPEQK